MKRVLVITFIMIVAFSFVACTPASNEETTAPSTVQPTKAADTSTVATTEAPNAYDGSLPLTDELTTLTYVTHSGNSSTSPKPSNDLLLYQILEEKTNVHIEFEVVTKDVYVETVGARLASGVSNLPDMINLSGIKVNHADLEESGAIIEQTELFEEYAYWSKLLFEENPDTFGLFYGWMKNPNGKLYSLLTMSVDYRYHTMGMMMNECWLEDFDLEMPQTIDEFTEVLKVFRDNDMNGNEDTTDEIPLVGQGGNVHVIAQAFGLEYGSPTKGYKILDDGSVRYEAAQPEFKEYLAYMNMLYTEGLLSKDYGTITWTQVQEYASNNTMGAATWWLQGATTLSAVSPLANDQSGETAVFIPMIPLEGPYGDRAIYAQQSCSSTGDSIAISGSCENPELAMKWIDYQFASPEINELVLYGQEGVHHTVVDGEMVKATPPDGQTYLYWMAQQGFFQQPRSQYKSIEYVKASMTDWWVEEVVKADPYYRVPTLAYGRWNLSAEQSDKLKELASSDLETYASESIAQFISGEKSLDEFDSYVEQLNNMNLNEILDVYAQSHAAMMNR